MDRPDYDTLLDQEIKQFIADTERWYPPDAVGLSISEQRQVYNRMCRAFAAGRPSGVSTVDQLIDNGAHAIPVRLYQTGAEVLATVIYYHGGGFVVGGLESHDNVCAEICAHTGLDVISVDYRLSPEHPFPSDFEDALVAFQHISDLSGRPVVLAGDSAGACLAAAVSHASRGAARSPVGQVLIYPGLGGDMTRGSYVEHATAPMLTTQDVGFYHQMRTDGDMTRLDDPRYSPLRDTNFADLPPTYVVTAGCDPLAQDGDDYCRQITNAGGTARCINEPGLVHGYLRARHSSELAKQSFKRLVDAIDTLGRTGKLPTI